MEQLQLFFKVGLTASLVFFAGIGCSERQFFLKDEPTEAQTKEPIDDRFIIVLNKKELLSAVQAQTHQKIQDTIDAAMSDLALAIQKPAIRKFKTSVAGGVFHLTDTEVRALREHPLVDFIERDGVVTASQSQTTLWNLDRIDQRQLPLDGQLNLESGPAVVHTYVVDTGVRVTHDEFEGRARHGFDFVDNDSDATDCDGHGTHVAGTLGGRTVGVAKNALIYGVRVLDCSGSGRLSDVIAGVDWITENHQAPAIANLSLGGGPSQSLDEAIQASIDAGVTYVVAAGNENTSACNGSPSRLRAAISVGATTPEDTRASFSNFGSCVDIFAPGTSIRSAWSSRDDRYETLDGTSMAAPLVAGIAAVALSHNPELSPSQIESALVNGSTEAVLSNIRTGSPNRLASTLFIQSDTDVETPEDPLPDGLKSGDILSALTANRFDESIYALSVPEGTRRLRVQIQGLGDADLYVRKDLEPSVRDYDCRPYRSTSNETCQFQNPSPGIYYIMLRAYRTYSGVELRVDFE